MTAAWTLERDTDGIAWLTLDVPGGSANTLGRAVLAEFAEKLSQLETQPPRGVIIRSGKRSGFIAGADIREFTTLRSVDEALDLIRHGQRIFDRLERLPCPTVAAIAGFCVGGGLELALACRYRIGLDDERLALGLPEVMLGIHPGFGGTVRAVRVMGAANALDLMLTGKSLRAERALRTGLIDHLCENEDALKSTARDLITQQPAAHRPTLTQRAMSWPFVRPWLRKTLEAQVRRKARREHYPAPYAIIDLWVRYGAVGEAAYEAEAQSIAKLFLTDTARNLVRTFFLQDQLKSQATAGVSAPRHIHVIGAGVMGGDIAAWCALRGLQVTLQDSNPAALEAAQTRADTLWSKRIRDPQRRTDTAARFRLDPSGDGAAEADLVLEAIVEKLEAKVAVFRALEPRLKSGAILATNTSSIPLESLAAGLSDPTRLVGIHFFNPVASLPLVEIVHTSSSRPEAIAAAIAFARKIDKLPLPCRSSPGFLVNRVLVPYMQEAMHAAAEGVPFEVIDQAAVEFGLPMGPVELSDVVGLDVCRHVGAIVASALGRSMPDSAALDAKIAAGQLGRKSGAGLYVWKDGRAQKSRPTETAPDDLQDRLVLALVNECVACWREGLVREESLIDAGMIFGTGFPPFRGGPLVYARERGLAACEARLRELAARHGSRFTPDPGWRQLRSTARPGP
ncbi:MAG: 3-hydroxyacyl-CoA dehydrogenase NAD-binding domain-containing protein [Steroidobacteraceae bacterium]